MLLSKVQQFDLVSRTVSWRHPQLVHTEVRKNEYGSASDAIDIGIAAQDSGKYFFKVLVPIVGDDSIMGVEFFNNEVVTEG